MEELTTQQIISISLAIISFLTILLVGIFSKLLKESDAENSPYSFSRFQLWLWTLVICPAFALNWGFQNNLIPKINVTSIILLSISGGVTLASTTISSIKEKANINKALDEKEPLKANLGTVEEKKVITDLQDQKVTTSNYNYWWTILIDGNNQISEVRLQQLVFTFIYIGIYITNFFSNNMVYPDFDNTAFVLMGISSGTYLIGKSLNK